MPEHSTTPPRADADTLVGMSDVTLGQLANEIADAIDRATIPLRKRIEQLERKLSKSSKAKR